MYCTPRAAPVSELVAEALLIEGARDVHIDVAYVRAGRLAVPQVRELGQVALAQCRAQATLKLGRPG